MYHVFDHIRSVLEGRETERRTSLIVRQMRILKRKLSVVITRRRDENTYIYTIREAMLTLYREWI
jgi:phosphoribosylaminoimidazole carboxylase (NCAIR synthetase)